MSGKSKGDEELFDDSARGFGAESFGSEARRWRRESADVVADCRVFRVNRHRCVCGERAGDFYVLDAPDWINVVPVTAGGEVVMIEQFRHGTEEVTLEIPGGMVDAGETPQDAARRELLEETGYAASEITLLGRTRPNPAIQNNWIYTFLARDARFDRAPVFDSTEHTIVRLVPLARVPALIADGTISHALVVVGFHWLTLRESSFGMKV